MVTVELHDQQNIKGTNTGNRSTPRLFELLKYIDFYTGKWSLICLCPYSTEVQHISEFGKIVLPCKLSDYISSSLTTVLVPRLCANLKSKAPCMR